MRIPDNVHHELCNWSRWCWQGAWPHPLPPTKCGSLESEYRAPPEWDCLDARREPIIRPHEASARIVQGVYDALPDPQRVVLKAEYPGKWTSGRIEGKATAATRLGIPVWAYDRHLQAAVERVGEAFAGVEA